MSHSLHIHMFKSSRVTRVYYSKVKHASAVHTRVTTHMSAIFLNYNYVSMIFWAVQLILVCSLIIETPYGLETQRKLLLNA